MEISPMAYKQDTLRLVIGGKIGQDIWRTSLDFGVTLVGIFGPTAAQLNDILNNKWNTGLDTWWTNIKPKNTPSVDYSFSALYWYPMNTSVSPAVGLRSFTASPGTGVSQPFPMRTCLVVSKKTNFAGKTNRGRMYIPWTNPALLSNDG